MAIGSLAVRAADAPTSIKADVIEYNTKTGITTAKGNVVISQRDGQATAAAAEYNTRTKPANSRAVSLRLKTMPELPAIRLFLHDENHTTAIGNAAMKKQDKTLRAAQVEYYKDRNFMETVGSWGELAMDEAAFSQQATSTMMAVLATQPLRITYRIVSNARNLTAAANKATYDTNNQGTIELTGNATATQNGNTISGNRLRIINENNTSEAAATR